MIETNGPANIVTHLRMVEAGLTKLDTAYIEKQALLSMKYMRGCEVKDGAPQWHDIIKADEKAREGDDDIPF